MSKPIRILTAILASLAIGGMFAYQDAQKNAPTYQQHPATVILTDFFCGFLSGLIFYVGSGWLARLKERKLEKAGDEKFYEEVARELQEKPMVPGLWTKAFAEMGGDDAKARALYIKYRVAQLAEARRQGLEKNRFITPQEEKSKRIRNIFGVFAMFVFTAAILTAIFGVDTSNKNVKANASTVTPTESEFDRQKQLAEKGNINAQEYMGLCYSIAAGQEVLRTNSNSANQDYVKAIKWYRMAADQGSAQGQFFLGYCYSGGRGVAQDFAEAIKWYRKSADQNYPAAQMSLGDCYFLGQGVTKNQVEAVKWYHKAGERGNFFSSQMTPEQIAEAQKLSEAFVPQKEKTAQ